MVTVVTVWGLRGCRRLTTGGVRGSNQGSRERVQPTPPGGLWAVYIFMPGKRGKDGKTTTTTPYFYVYYDDVV